MIRNINFSFTYIEKQTKNTICPVESDIKPDFICEIRPHKIATTDILTSTGTKLKILPNSNLKKAFKKPFVS